MTLEIFPRPKRCELTGANVRPGELTLVRSSGFPPQGYRITIMPDGALRAEAGCPAGERYARVTAQQIRAATETPIRAGLIEDYPAMPVRGLMLDVSRDKLPRMATLKAIAERMAALKLNHLQLYMERSFAYAGHPPARDECGTYSADDIAELGAYCRALGIELAPNQNSLGHMERWLGDPEYAHLALAPSGSVNSLGVYRPPMTLDPAMRDSFTFVASLWAELMPHFDACHAQVGLDETWELEPARLPELARWAVRLRALPQFAGKTILAWADMFLQRPDLPGSLAAGITLCDWGYEADYDFLDSTGTLAAAGVPFWVCPGTSSWLSIAGRWPNARANCLAAAVAGQLNGAAGYLLTDWGDNGHLQPWSVSEPALAAAAAFSWGADNNRDVDVRQSLARDGYRDRTGLLAEAALRLGSLSALVTPQPSNMSALAVGLYYPWFRTGSGLTAGLSRADLEAVSAEIDWALQAIDRSSPSRGAVASPKDELQWVGDVMAMLVEDLTHRLDGDGSLASIARAARLDLAERCVELISRHRMLWLQRNRRTGLASSSRWLQVLADCFEKGEVTLTQPPRSI